MYRPLMIIAMAATVFGSALEPENGFSSKKVRQLELIDSLKNSDGNQSPIYPGLNGQQSNLPVLHFYPTYPEHSGKTAVSGYNGYLVPASPPKQTWTSSIVSTLLPISSYAISYGARAGVFVWNIFLLLLVGGILTTSICTFTPLCTITFLGLGISKDQVREQVSELARTYITPESVNAATLLVKRAIDKYAELQRQQRQEEERAQMQRKPERRRRR